MKNALYDYYSVLGVSYFASEEEIKSAYRKLVKEHHPDSATGDSKKFKVVIEAYEVLSSEDKRSRYDRLLFSKINVQGYSKQVDDIDSIPNKKKATNDKSKKRVPFYIALSFNILLIAVIILMVTNFNNYNSELEDENAGLTKDLEELSKTNKVLNEEYNTLENAYLDLELQLTDDSIVEEAAEEASEVIKTVEESQEIIANNPEDAFTQGSSKEHVKQVMGTPNSLSKMPLGGETWSYGNTAWVKFTPEGLVEGWYDYDGNVLKVQ